MDDKKDNQDLVVGSDGEVNQETKITVKSENTENSEPEVNDIQAPPDSTDIQSAQDNTENEDVNIPPEDDVESELDAAPVVKMPENDIDNLSSPTVPDEDIPEDVASVSDKPDPFAPDKPAEALTPTTPQTMSNNEQAKPHEHRNNKKLAVIITVLVALLLASAAVYVYISAQDNATQSNSQVTSQQNTSEVEVAPATTEDIDQSVAEIDATILLLENDAELAEDSISDSSLGL